MAKQFRFIFKMADVDVIGIWRKYDLDAFLKDCRAFAENDVSFRVEFYEVRALRGARQAKE